MLSYLSIFVFITSKETTKPRMSYQKGIIIRENSFYYQYILRIETRICLHRKSEVGR
jgi:hypothetical protein